MIGAPPASGAQGAAGTPPPTAGSEHSAAGAPAPNGTSPNGANGTAIDPNSASYEVPVPAELSAFARYPVGPVDWRVRGAERRLEYESPTDLIGSARRIQLRGPDSASGAWLLREESLGTAECTAMDAQIVCREELPGVEVDADVVAARVRAGELAPERLDVTRSFETDPIGVLRFPAP